MACPAESSQRSRNSKASSTLKLQRTMIRRHACYFEANRKPGHACFKPSQDREVVKGADDYTLMQTNEEERWAQKPFGAYINQAERMNVLRVVYRTVTTPTDITQPALHAQPSGDTGEVLTPSVSLS